MGVTVKWRLSAFAWGFAEATLFFIVPDVLLTLAAVKLGWQKALRLVLYALSGALLGGAIMYGLGAMKIETARTTVETVPLISADMTARVSAEMRGDWIWSMGVGAVTGTPYKVFAIEAPGAGISLGVFWLGSIFVRSIRWLLTLAIAAIVADLLKRAGVPHVVMPLWALMWIAFYAFYCVIMSG